MQTDKLVTKNFYAQWISSDTSFQLKESGDWRLIADFDVNIDEAFDCKEFLELVREMKDYGCNIM